MPNMRKGAAGLYRSKTDAASDASLAINRAPDMISAVAASPATWRPLALAVGEDHFAVKNACTNLRGTSSEDDDTRSVHDTRNTNDRRVTTSRSEYVEVSINSTKKFSVVRSLGAEEIRLSPLARPRRAMPSGPADGKRLLVRAGARLCKGSDGSLATMAKKPVQDQTWRGWEGETEAQEEDEDEMFAYDEAQLVWTLDDGPNGGGSERELAGDKKLGSSTPRAFYVHHQPSVSIDRAGGKLKDTGGTEGSAPAAGSSTLDASSTNSQFETGRARSTADHTVNLTIYAKESLRDALKDEHLKRQKRFQTKQAAFASRDRANAATITCRQIDEMVISSRERSVDPAASKIATLQQAWIDKRDEMPRAEEKARAAAIDLAEAQKALLAATAAFESARSAQETMLVSLSHDEPALNPDILSIAGDSAGVALMNARKGAKIAQAWIQSASAAAVDAANGVDVAAVERMALAHEIARANTVHRAALVTHQELEARLRVATKAKETARQDATNLKINCIKPFQECIAAKNRTERTRKTYELLLGRGRKTAFVNGRCDAPGSGAEYGGPPGEGQADGMKRRAAATAGGNFEVQSEDDMMVVVNTAGSSDKGCTEDRALKRRRHLGVFVS